MFCIAKTASCRTFSPASVQLNKLVAAGEIPDTPLLAAGQFILCPGLL